LAEDDIPFASSLKLETSQKLDEKARESRNFSVGGNDPKRASTES